MLLYLNFTAAHDGERNRANHWWYVSLMNIRTDNVSCPIPLEDFSRMYRIFLGQSVVPANVPLMYGTLQAASKPKNGTVRYGAVRFSWWHDENRWDLYYLTRGSAISFGFLCSFVRRKVVGHRMFFLPTKTVVPVSLLLLPRDIGIGGNRKTVVRRIYTVQRDRCFWSR